MRITVDVDLTTINCGGCSGTYAINERFRQKKYEDGGAWHCPYCQCSWGYRGTEIQRLKKRLQREEAEHDQTRAELKHTESRRRAEKAAKARLKNRISKGVCPCCRRHFMNLQRHMASKHPDFVKHPTDDRTEPRDDT